MARKRITVNVGNIRTQLARNMGNKKEAKGLKFGVNLQEQALYQIKFLQTINDTHHLRNKNVLRRALYRYECYWLPLAAEHRDQFLSAPLDVEWIWHCHMLSPRAYESDCQTIVGCTVNHALFKRKEFAKKQKTSQMLWSEKYRNDKETFDVDFNAQYDEDAVDTFKSKLSYDIISATERQSVFYYQVSLPHYKDRKYLDNCLLRYKRFIFLKKTMPKAFICPCYDIDLIWHAHQLNPLVYKDDMVKIIGHLFNHDDSVNDRGEDSKLSNANRETKEAWINCFNEKFSMFGAMYRGNPPVGSLYKITLEDTHSLCTKISQVNIENMTWHVAHAELPYKKIKVKGAFTAFAKQKKLFTLNNKDKSNKDRQPVVTWANVGCFEFDSKMYETIKFNIQECENACVCFETRSEIGSCDIDLLSRIEDPRHFNMGGSIKESLDCGDGNTLEVVGNFSKPQKDRLRVFVDQGKFESATIPENIQQLWGPVALERLPLGVDNKCLVATHRLQNHIGKVHTTVRVIHSQRLMMSVIQVFYHDKMSVVAHLIGSEQLPLPTQVCDNQITLNPKEGERALLIKNNDGDWGIISGRWAGRKLGVAGTSQSHKGKHGSPGTLHV